jgi:hypothetical protein
MLSFHRTEFHVDETVEPPKMVCLRAGLGTRAALIPTVVKDARVKYGDDYDIEVASPRSRAKARTAGRQRVYRMKKMQMTEDAGSDR